MPKGGSRRRRRGGADSWANYMREKVGLAPVAADVPAPAPPPVPAVVAEPVQMAKTAGKRIKRHTGFNPASPGDARKLLKTAKGDKMLGGRRRKTRRRRS